MLGQLSTHSKQGPCPHLHTSHARPAPPAKLTWKEMRWFCLFLTPCHLPLREGWVHIQVLNVQAGTCVSLRATRRTSTFPKEASHLPCGGEEGGELITASPHTCLPENPMKPRWVLLCPVKDRGRTLEYEPRLAVACGFCRLAADRNPGHVKPRGSRSRKETWSGFG